VGEDSVTKLIERPVATVSTLHWEPFTDSANVIAAEDFYTNGAGKPAMRIQIRASHEQSGWNRRWLAEYAEAQFNSFLSLSEGWDGYRAKPIAMNALDVAIRLFFSLIDDLSVPPQMFPLVDGGIQLEWHVANESVEVEIGGDGMAHALAVNAHSEVVLDEMLSEGGTESMEATKQAVRRLCKILLGHR